jgi:hypothetical protein
MLDQGWFHLLALFSAYPFWRGENIRHKRFLLCALFSADPAGERGREDVLPPFFLLIKSCQVKREVSVHSFQRILPREE